uniref:Uncharacterized protein n=1 Tax=Rhizophora mucronata TaxID=61149 RepID=A0A2P2Q862_RHIMU
MSLLLQKMQLILGFQLQVHCSLSRRPLH